MSPAVRSDSSSKGKRQMTRGVPGSKKIVNELLPGFSRQMAAMLSAGMPIVATLDALEEQSDNPNFRNVIAKLKASIENGAAFSDALRQFPSIFDNLYSNMVRGGETGGQLAETIARLAGFLESSAKLRRKVKSAMMYPTIILCIALTIAVAMIVFIVPVFGEMFADFDADLPAPTQFLLNISAGMKRYGIVILIGIVAVVIAFKRWKATPSGGYQWDKLLLKAPVFGELRKKVASARFARTFGQLIKSGVPILQALEIVSGATGSVVAEHVIKNASVAVENGDPLSNSMQNQDVFPILLVRMLQAGEKTGKIDEMMDNIADFYDDEVDSAVAALTSMLEPIMMVFMGGSIGTILIAMYLPIFTIADTIT